METLSWAHHQLVAPLSPKEQEKWLYQAEQNGWSVGKLRAEIRRARGKQVPAIPVTAVTHIEAFAYIRLASHPPILGDPAIAHANLRWGGALQTAGNGKILTTNATTTPEADWYSVAWDVTGGQLELDGATIRFRIGGEVDVGEIWACYVAVTSVYDPWVAAPEPSPRRRWRFVGSWPEAQFEDF